MEAKTVFKRYELKYLMDEDQASAVLDVVRKRMMLDRYGRSTIRNVYLDTPDFLLARRSIDRPLYKEKLRIRAYGEPSQEDEVFVEMKKKFDSVVYKRRLRMPLREAEGWFRGECEAPRSQIGEEIDFMRVRYPDIRPAMFLSYDREAYCAGSCSDLRITIDSRILARTEALSLSSPIGGRPVLPEGYTLMEIKTMYGYPGWLTGLLNSQRLYKSRFTKYGNAYKEIVLGKVPEEFLTIPGCGCAEATEGCRCPGRPPRYWPSCWWRPSAEGSSPAPRQACSIHLPRTTPRPWSRTSPSRRTRKRGKRPPRHPGTRRLPKARPD